MVQQAIGIIIALGVLTLIFFAIEKMWPANPAQPMWWRRGDKWTNLTYWFLNPFFTELVRKVLIALTLVLLFQESIPEIKARLQSPDSWIARQPVGLQFIAVMIVGDFISYWMHRLFHTNKRLWKFHAVHHSPEELDWLVAARVHPVNDWIMKWSQLVVLVLLGFSPLVVAAYAPVLLFFAILFHANVNWDFGPLRSVIASPVFHRWHHTSLEEGLDKNFAGFFPWIDKLFGTYYMPKGRYPEKFGTPNDNVGKGFWQQMCYPFRKSQV